VKTLAVWYEAKDGHKDNRIGVKIHINFFKLKRRKFLIFKEHDYMIELGFMIDDISKIAKLNIHFPFIVKKEDFTDIGSLLFDKRKLINSIFNEHYEVISNQLKQGSVKKMNSEEGFTIHKIDFKNNETIENPNGDYKLSKKYKGTLLSLNLKNTPEGQGGESYIRFRLKLNKRQDFIKNNYPSDRFLQSAFTTVEALDFRINEKRSYRNSLAKEILEAREFIISKIVFVLVREAKDDLVLPSGMFSCREMETVWKGYFKDNPYDLKNMIIYQFSENPKSAREHFNLFVKIKVRKSTIWTVLLFIVFFLLLSILGNFLFSLLKSVLRCL
jgi:hypothetical protein